MTLAEALGLGAFDLPEQEEARRIRLQQYHIHEVRTTTGVRKVIAFQQ